MKKKMLLIIMMFMFITNVNALTFNVNVTNIEDEGNNGTIGSIEKIDLENKELDVLFQDIGDEVSFSITVTNTGDRVGTLRNIDITTGNDKIEYSSNLPDGGLAINGNDTNKVIVTAKVKEGAVNGKTTSEIKIKYTYDEGSCPEGEILSEDESMCLSPEGMERNEEGICVKPETPVVCNDDEIYNETKKICEKKVIPTPINPSNPKTLDNIILITLLFFVSGLGIYAVMFKKLNTNKKKVTAGVITGVITLALSFTVLASVFGLDNLLGAIINPITKSKELVVKVNEEIDLIETWDGECSLDVTELTPSNIFEGGSGTESDPYQVKTAEQLSCFAKSVNNGTTYEGQFIKQTKNIKLNDNLSDQINDLSNAHLWITVGYINGLDDMRPFMGTYNGDSKKISGLYVTNDSAFSGYYKGLFGYAKNATFKDLIISDVYMSTSGQAGALLGYAQGNLNVDGITTYGGAVFTGQLGAGIVGYYDGQNEAGTVTIENSENNINIDGRGSGGVISWIESMQNSDEPNLIIRNVVNNGNITMSNDFVGGVVNVINADANILIDGAVNNGNITSQGAQGGSHTGGVIATLYSGQKLVMRNSANTGNLTGFGAESGPIGGVIGNAYVGIVTMDNCYNSGNIEGSNVYLDGITRDEDDILPSSTMYVGGILGYGNGSTTITNSYNTGKISGKFVYVGGIYGGNGTSVNIENCYNLGEMVSAGYVGGIAGSTATIRNSYNKGRIILYSMCRAGGILGGFSGGKVYNSYNEGELLLTTKYSTNLSGGVCAECDVENSYNRGNITIKYSANQVAGVAAYSSNVKNCYNSGNIVFEDASPNLKPDSSFSSSYLNSTVYIGGINNNYDDYYPTNTYNLGNITVNVNSQEYDENSSPNIALGGIGSWTGAKNSVNTGDVTVKVNAQLNSRHCFYLSGIALSTAIDSFNAGTLSIDSDYDITQDTFGEGYDGPKKNYISIGQISNDNYDESTGNRFNTDPNGFALACANWYCTAEQSQSVGIYTTEEAPDILSIINGDNAFNDELDEDGLPTLKVFNE